MPIDTEATSSSATLDEKALEAKIQSFGRIIFESVESLRPGRLDAQFYYEQLMEYAMRDEQLKLSMFRFVDVLPALPSARAILDHVDAYFTPIAQKLPPPIRLALKTPRSGLTDSIAAKMIKKQISFVADNFIVGKDADSAIAALEKLRKNGLAYTVDLVGEAAVSERESNDYLEKYIHLIGVLYSQRKKFESSHSSLEGHQSEKAAINVSIKLSALYSQVKPSAFENSVETLSARVAEILRAAKEYGVFVNFDMEDSGYVDITLETFKNLLEQEEFNSYPHFGIVCQAYLKRSEADLRSLIEWNKKREVPITIRLVKGA